MGIKAEDKEDDLFALAAKGGTGAEKGVPVGGILLGSDGRQVTPPPIETRIKAPADPKGAVPKVDKPKVARGTATEKQAAEIADTLEDKAAVIFGLLTAAMPVTGVYATENSPKAIKALIEIGKRRPAVLRALMKVADGADAMEIAKFVLGVACAVQIDMGRMTPDAFPAKAFGVTAIIEQFFMDDVPAEPNTNVTGQDTNAARFQPVS